MSPRACGSSLQARRDCLDEQGGAYRLRRSYDDESPEYCEFGGTPMADECGGWGGERSPSVEFFHPTRRIINAALAAGFRLRRVEEHTLAEAKGEERRMQLPHDLMILAEKASRHEHPLGGVTPSMLALGSCR